MEEGSTMKIVQDILNILTDGKGIPLTVNTWSNWELS